MVGGGVQRPEDSKISKILSLAVPTTKKEVRSLLGVLNYYRKFVSNFSAISAPLSDLTKGGQPDKVVWTSECQDALEALQAVMSSKPVLVLPDIRFPFVLRTDASDRGLGATLLQPRCDDGDEILHPVIYASRKLLDREMKYGIGERECLSIVWGVTKLSRYLYGREFVIETDHAPLRVLEKQTSHSGRLSRWALTLQQFKFQVRPISGVVNSLADILSRCPAS